uniref:NADH-ubiquinone oxidoreductase chain 2 n=1 Tax=Xystrocera globosa TaxID=1191653 RepID=A0A5J6EI03_9CUCU|nr:NADH dehydrogenase subunit 2 [Xystrocera globosa]QEU57257.1 NADH dehydrogenase subunit 2 [Xystrocera globosa]
MKFFKMMFLSTTILGTLIAISSYSWLSMWIGLEINLLSIIPILVNQVNLYSTESALKYFITQALASSILLFAIIMSLNMNEFLPQSSDYLAMMILNSALLMKMGAAPFHAWFPEVLEGLNWFECLLMLTWQKIAPMILLMYNLNMTFFLISVIIFSSLLGSLLGLNQVSMRKIMAYSSINHIGWMIASMMLSASIWSWYFLVYSLISINIVMILIKLKAFYLTQLMNSLNSNKSMKIFFSLNFLSLGGLPPFLGFFPKWLTINGLVENNFFLVSVILILLTLITLFFYLRITFSSLTLNFSESMVFTKQQKMSFSETAFNALVLSGLIYCPILYSSL